MTATLPLFMYVRLLTARTAGLLMKNPNEAFICLFSARNVFRQSQQSKASLYICISSRLQWTQQMSHLTASQPVKCVFAYLTTAPRNTVISEGKVELQRGGGFRCRQFVTCTSWNNLTWVFGNDNTTTHWGRLGRNVFVTDHRCLSVLNSCRPFFFFNFKIEGHDQIFQLCGEWKNPWYSKCSLCLCVWWKATTVGGFYLPRRHYTYWASNCNNKLMIFITQGLLQMCESAPKGKQKAVRSSGGRTIVAAEGCSCPGSTVWSSSLLLLVCLQKLKLRAAECPGPAFQYSGS